MYPKLLTLFAFLFVLHATCLAQFYPTQYRPPNQDWQQLDTEHFNLIYASENHSQALELAQILESQYPDVQHAVGGDLDNFPIILNNYNDRSNGFVSPHNFRSEIELPPIKGKSLNPQTGNWLANVGPHELVHALQFSNLGEYNIPRFISLFSPDMARSFHGAIPSGMLEGIAVHYETEHITSHGGRGNYPIFTQQFDATFNGSQRWSMGQLLHSTRYTRPFGRHYIGGYEFTNWLHNRFGETITRQALDFYMDFSFLGYGVALRHATGYWPGQLYNRFEDDHETNNKNFENNTPYLDLELPFKGAEVRRPKWLSNDELIFYGSFYNARSGFYSYDLSTEKFTSLFSTNAVQDYWYDLSADQSELVFSYYETDPLYDRTAKAELVRYDFESQQKEQLTNGGRLYAPSFYGDELLALKSVPGRSKLVARNGSNLGDEREVFSAPNHDIKAVATHPDRKQLAITSNKNGQQALWITPRDNVTEQLTKKPELAFRQGSIFDPEWHPDGDKLLFSADFSGAHQLYEWNRSSDEVRQVTNHSFGAFEGSYNEDGSRIAYIYQQNNERLPAIIDRSDFVGDTIAEYQQEKAKTPVVADSVAKASKSWNTSSYSSGMSWLKPRTVLPFVDNISTANDYEVGVSLHSVNTLSTQSYSTDISYFKGQGWYDVMYQNKTFFPGFTLRAFNEPSFRSVQSVGLLGRQERSLAASIPLQIDLNQNIYSTSFFIEPELRQSQIRFFDANFNRPLSDFANITIGNLFTRFNYRLQQNIRDLQPNTGLIVYSEIEHYLGNDELNFSSFNNDIFYSSPNATALHAGAYGYVAPLKRWNQSLRLGLRGLTQSALLFDNQSLVSNGFSEFVLPNAQNIISFDSRYTVPIAYVDNGGLLLPLYLSNIYAVAFSNTIADPTLDDWYNGSRTVFGIGLRASFKLSNLNFNIGVGIGYEPTRQKTQVFIGDF